MDRRNKKPNRIKARKDAFDVLLFAMLIMSLFSACRRYEPAAVMNGVEATLPSETEETAESTEEESSQEPSSSETAESTEEETTAAAEIIPERSPVRVKGIYLTANAAGVTEFMDKIIQRIDDTELNAVVIDVKDDYGKITYQMEGVPLVSELSVVEVKIDDLPALMEKLKAHGIYTIARLVALKDPYIASKKPEWALHLSDGTVYRDRSGDAWVNPYKQEYWDYLVDVAKAAGKAGFDEIQFDYIRFCTERGVGDVVYDEADTQGRDKIAIISELVQYLTKKLRAEGLFVSCDVFGTIIGSQIDAESVGQDYVQMAQDLDYLCPMIYPSHYASGNFGIEHPDLEPYQTITGALKKSRGELKSVLTEAEESGRSTAIVRPWLQSFTASYLGSGNYRQYNAETTRAQIQAVYDAGYDEWLLWSASANYYYDGLLTQEEGDAEAVRIAESRALLPEETDESLTGETDAEGNSIPPEETFPPELQEALSGDDLSESDIAILEQEGDIIITEAAKD